MLLYNLEVNLHRNNSKTKSNLQLQASGFLFVLLTDVSGITGLILAQ